MHEAMVKRTKNIGLNRKLLDVEEGFRFQLYTDLYILEEQIVNCKKKKKLNKKRNHCTTHEATYQSDISSYIDVLKMI